ncbi:hypothetical protein [Microbacterium sp. bgisy203]|uniref:hypothetical protein n=1 Tax=Microbacterium sp. bgisy203 TaxID=3413799 RepID=UPI003D745427
MTQTPEDLAETLTPHVYGATGLGVLALTAPGDAHPRVEYAGGDLFVGLDDSATGRAVTEGDAKAWSRPFREVAADAIRRAGALPAVAGGALAIDDETVAASVLIYPSRLSEVDLAGPPVLFALARDAVFVIGADDEDAVAHVLDRAEALYEGGGPLISAHPLVLTPEGWAPFAWREALPELAPRFERVLRLYNVRAYEAQAPALQRPDLHVADPKIQMTDAGVTVTIAAWPKGTATLLPVVDNVIVADPAGTLSVATFDQFLDAGGDAIVRTGLSPLRYFVPGAAPRGAQA